MYLMLCTRPDTVGALGCVAMYCDEYDQSHWIAVKRIIRYLNTTKISNRLTEFVSKMGLYAMPTRVGVMI
jgi:hypothetical protein